MIQELRSRNKALVFCLPLARSFDLEHQHISRRAYENFTRVYDATTLLQAKLKVKDWIPPEWEGRLSDKFICAAIDNLDMYCRKMHTRIKDGECVKSHMLHAVVTERILFDKAILPGPPPTGDMLIRETEEIVKHAALPSRKQVHVELRRHWTKHVTIAKNCVKPSVMLDRPPASCDRQTIGRTQCVSMPILVNRSTASKVDVAAAINNVREQFPGAKLVLFMDYQTFAVAWWLKARTPDLYTDVIIVGGELHRQFHTDDCVYRLWWNYVLEPAAMWLYRISMPTGTTTREILSASWPLLVSLGCADWFRRKIRSEKIRSN